MPIIWDGNGFSDSSGGIRNPAALVRIVDTRKIAVRPAICFEPSIPNINQADDYMDHRERRQAHTQYHDAPPKKSIWCSQWSELSGQP